MESERVENLRDNSNIMHELITGSRFIGKCNRTTFENFFGYKEGYLKSISCKYKSMVISSIFKELLSINKISCRIRMKGKRKFKWLKVKPH